ncbi:hypothetical protein GCM10027418_17470 [Mariniluteicoccus endophyticus]
MTGPVTAYAAFDRFPAAKGSAVHIARAAGALFEHAGPGLLCVLGGESMPLVQHEPGVTITRFRSDTPNLFDRADAYAVFVDEALQRHRDTIRLVQVRDPWSAAPALADPDRPWKVVYEANGFPSIELPTTFPHVPAETLAKIAAVEDACLVAADAVVTPSATIAACCIAKGADPAKVTVVPNGADPVTTPPDRPADAPARYLVYVGALQGWQGFGTLLRAYAGLADLDVDLVVCSSWSARRAKGWKKVAERLGIADRVHWRHELPHEEVAAHLAHAELSLAPLAEVDRNVRQGCCPLKVVESMAAGVPVVASDLPCVRELVDESCARLVPPDRPAELSRAVRVLLGDRERRAELATAARVRATERFTWNAADERLREVWGSLSGPGSA